MCYPQTFSPTIFMYVSTAFVANVFPLNTKFSLSDKSQIRNGQLIIIIFSTNRLSSDINR